MKTAISYILAFLLGILMISPAFDYAIPVWKNCFDWAYFVVVSGTLGFLLLHFRLHLAIKFLVVYLLFAAFISQSPYASFTAYMLTVITLYLFLLFQQADFKIILNVIESCFWFQFILVCFQLAGMDTLLNFNRSESLFLGTVMQYMRFSSLLAIMTPFLIYRRPVYIFPILALCVVSQSSSFFVSVIAGIATFFFLRAKSKKTLALTALGALICVGLYALYDYGSFEGAIVPSNGGRLVSWYAVLRTWVFDTAAAIPPALDGPFQWQWFLFGHGQDTFLTLFPIYKHDANPFPQAHNCWLQLPWEIGLIGAVAAIVYAAHLFFRLVRAKLHVLASGEVTIATNMFFAFPTRMTQTALLIVAFCALCEVALRKRAYALKPEEV